MLNFITVNTNLRSFSVIAANADKFPSIFHERMTAMLQQNERILSVVNDAVIADEELQNDCRVWKVLVR